MKRSPIESGFHAVVEAFTRKAEATRLRLAAHGVRCDACFAVSLRPELLEMRAGLARLAATRTSGLAKPGEVTSGTAPTEPAVPAWRGPISGGTR